MGSLPKTMKAVVSIGATNTAEDIINIKVVTDFPVPVPGDRQVLIKVASSSVNPTDCALSVMSPGSKPKVLGSDVAGTIVQVGSGCTRLKVGDEVWATLYKQTEYSLEGSQLGAWAEYAVADESQVGKKPHGLNFEEAGTLPLVGKTLFQNFKQAGFPWEGRHNLSMVVTSGAGGTGTIAVQFAKAYGASQIITAASPFNNAMLKQLGATVVVDYHTSSIWDALHSNSVDFVYDNYGAPGSADKAMPAIRPGGAYGVLPGTRHSAPHFAKHPKPGVQQYNFGSVDGSGYQDLDALATLVNSGELKAVVQSTYVLEDIVQALRDVWGGHVVGKVSIKVASELATVVML